MTTIPAERITATGPPATGLAGGPEQAAIEARDVVKTYPGGVRALDGLSFSVEPGMVFAILGPNGAGKTTTVRILTTLSRADSGTARVAGFDVGRQAEQVRRSIGVVGQKTAVDPIATGRENMTLQGRVYGMGGATLKRRVTALLDRFGLTDAANRTVGTYSGGMQRKLDVAMGLIHQPRVLFLDEPTTGLDPEARAELWAEIRHLTMDEGLTILMTTHYLEEADQLARRLAIVDHGRVVAEGAPEALKSELHGDAVQVELRDADPDAHAARVVARVDGVRDPHVEGRILRARADRGASAVPAVIAALDGEGIGVASVTVARPSLDDVYLRHTGRSYSSNDQEVSR
jgi:ABC-2 type transport system ATP-binding protein